MHLVTNTGDMQRPIGERLPLRDFTVSVSCENQPQRVWAAGGGAVAYDWQEGKLELKIVELDLYEVVVVEW